MRHGQPNISMKPVAVGRQVTSQPTGSTGSMGAPPVYRPQASAPVQGKMTAPLVYRPQSGSPVQGKMVAPPVYRPQVSSPQQPNSSVAHPHRPQISRSVQRKLAAPPVYRPQPMPIQPRMPDVTGSIQGVGYVPQTLSRPGISGIMPRQNAVNGILPQPNKSLIQAKPSAALQNGIATATPQLGIPALSIAPKSHHPQQPPSLIHPSRHVLQRKVSIYKDKTLNAYQIDGRPDFTNSLKKDLFTEADNDGESYVVKFSDNHGVSFQFPSVHRRHKLAWSLWRTAVNKLLAEGTATEMENLMKLCYVPNVWKKWTNTEFKDAYRNGSYLAKLANDFFNHPDNLWLGPGDENMGKGGGLDKLIAAYVNNPSKKTRKALKESAFDPHNKNEFEYREPDATTGETGNWYYYDIPQTPRSDHMEYATDHFLNYLQ
jgi:hypothetical protein